MTNPLFSAATKPTREAPFGTYTQVHSKVKGIYTIRVVPQNRPEDDALPPIDMSDLGLNSSTVPLDLFGLFWITLSIGVPYNSYTGS